MATAIFWGVLGGLIFSNLLAVELLGAPAWAGWALFAVLAGGFAFLKIFYPDDDTPISWARYRAGSRSAARDYDESR